MTDPAQAPSASRAGFEHDLVALVPQLRAFARTLCGDPTFADDLAQETVAKAWAARESYTLGTNLKAWLFMILRNQFYSEKRRSWRSSQLDPEVAVSKLVAADDPSVAVELDELRRALAMLPDEQREPLILVGAAGLAYEDVSAITGVATGTIKSRVSRGRDRLARILASGQVRVDGRPAHEAMAAICAQIDTYRAQAA